MPAYFWVRVSHYAADVPAFNQTFRLRCIVLLISASAFSLRCSGLQPSRLETAAPSVANQFRHRTGDLVFQDLDCGPLCDAIEAVTGGVGGCDISHMGMVVERRTVVEHDASHEVLQQSDAHWFVLEALSPTVRLVPLSNFLSRSLDAVGRPKVIVGRLRSTNVPQISDAVAVGLKYLDTPYDERFLMGDDALYCSELIYLIFKDGATGSPLFPLAPMTFRSPQTGVYFPVWIDYFAELGVPIPEGAVGTNPAAISCSPVLRIVYRYGQLDCSHP